MGAVLKKFQHAIRLTTAVSEPGLPHMKKAIFFHQLTSKVQIQNLGLSEES